MNTETPQTDTAKFTHQDACLEGMRPERELVDAYFARTLERERDEARKEAERFRDDLESYGANTDVFPWENKKDSHAK